MKYLNHYEHVFSSVQVGSVTLKNRIVGLPMMDGMASPDGMVTPELLAHIRMRAKSGAAVITLGDSCVDYTHGVTHYTPLDIGNPANMAGLNAIADECHRFGARASIELQHGGMFAYTPLLKDGKRFAVSPFPKGISRRPDITDESIHVMTKQDFRDIIELYCRSVDQLRRAEFDMVLVHSGHGWLVWQFLSPVFNQREDEYGGSLENRMRFPLELFRAIRETAGRGMAIDMRVTGHPRNKKPETEMGIPELVTYLKAVSQYADAVNVSASSAAYMESGQWMCQSYYLPHKANADFARMVKEADVSMKVTAAGSFTTIGMADEWLASGGSDLVGMGRALLADEHHVLKAYRGQEERVRPCIRCAYCTNRLETFEHTRCTVNPIVGRMDEYPYQPLPRAPVSKNVVIIGGGIAGMQAAQTAVQRGHDVTLYEKGPELGGLVKVSASLPDKYDMRRYLAWMVNETERCGAKIELNSEITPEKLEAISPEAVLVAIGAAPARPNIPGVEGDNVVLAGFVDTREVEPGERVIVAGAGLTGAETAVDLARRGKDVTIVDMMGKDKFLMDTSGQIRESLRAIFENIPVRFLFHSTITSIKPDGLEYKGADGENKKIPGDTIVNALGMRVDTEKVDALLNVTPESFAIGDCNGGRMYMLHAIESAFAYAMEL
jgi:2,4-dienoyl-CoA reductase-like NADH-dependent reductase (Old Yellow Enzyme family)/thioredoxin reductase